MCLQKDDFRFFFSSQQDALKMFLDKFASKIIPEYMSQRDFLLCVANDAFLSQECFVLVF